MVYTIQKHLQNILIGCVSGLCIGVFFGVYTLWEKIPNSGIWVILVPTFVTLFYFLVILYPTYLACKYWNKKDKQIQDEIKRE